jgi:predicted alpha/beta superfamily hydrolase
VYINTTMSVKMLSWLLSFLGASCLTLGGLHAQLTLQIGQLPVYTPSGSTLYAAGSFNAWNEADNAYAFQANSSGVLELRLPDLAAGSYDYKLTRGSWTSVEGNASGAYRPNRSLSYDGTPTTIVLDVLSWEDLSSTNSTAASNVRILSSDFHIPQLNRSRRIWLYLPPDYASSNRRYPVLYMHDGQNLFDAATSFAGEWKVDETLNRLFAAGDPGIIVVGIDNGGASRLAEYTPWPHPIYGGGEGAAYVDFLVETLKPYVDANYRTQSAAASTGIMGSSLGGLISLYAALRHPDIFGRAGVLSPSLWFTEDIYNYTDTVAQVDPLRLYFLAGGSESANTDVIADVDRMASQLEAVAYPATLELAFHPEGQHAEWYWAREFGAAYQWLFRELTALDQHPALPVLRVFPNPVIDTLYIEQLPGAGHNWELQVFSVDGNPQQTVRWAAPALDVSQLVPGVYFAVAKNGVQQWALLRFIKH